MRVTDLTFKRVGNLIAVRYQGVQKLQTSRGLRPYHCWLCLCSCDRLVTYKGQYLTSKKHPVSCGCLGTKGSKPKDITFNRFGTLVAVHIKDKSPNSDYNWLCRCDCGGTCTKPIGQLRAKPLSQNCGCKTRGRISDANSTHRRSKTTEYKSWAKIKERCYSPNCKSYVDYGAKGIQMQESWVDSFEDFYNYIGDKPTRYHTVDRIDPEKGYVEGNIRWASPTEQSRNTRASSKGVSKYKGVHLDKESGRWIACIAVNGVRRKIGRYDCELVAAYMYDEAFNLVFGVNYEYKQLNNVILDIVPEIKGSFWTKGYLELQQQVIEIDSTYI